MNPTVKKALRRCFLGFVIVVGLLVAVVYFIRWRTIGQWNDFRAHWEAQGEIFEVGELLPEPPPESQNLATHPWFTALQTEGLTDGSPLAVVDVETIPGFQKSDAGRSWERCEPADFSNWDDLGEGMAPEEIARELLARMAPAEETMDELVALLRHYPACYYPEGWEEVFTREVRHLFAFMTFADAYTSRAILRIQAGKGTEAVDDLLAILHLGSHAGQEPFLVGHLVEIAISRRFCAALWEGLRAQCFDEPSLEKLSAALPAPEALATRCLQSLRVERSALLQFIDNLEHGRHTGAAPDARQASFLRLWLASNRLAVCEDFQQHLLAPGGTFATRPTLAGAEAVEVSIEKRHQSLRRYTQTLALMALPAITKAISRTLTTEAHLNHARLAIALERHRLEHGAYPATLADLVPAVLPAVPTDLLNGRPIEYRLKADDTPLLYQWGCDGDDDGGRPRKDPLHGDIVWQYTADPPITGAEYSQKD